jgi:hypothetical protein
VVRDDGKGLGLEHLDHYLKVITEVRPLGRSLQYIGII